MLYFFSFLFLCLTKIFPGRENHACDRKGSSLQAASASGFWAALPPYGIFLQLKITASQEAFAGLRSHTQPTAQTNKKKIGMSDRRC